MKKGFTLVELLAVIILLALIFMLAFPSLLNVIRKDNLRLNENSEKLLITATRLYINDNANNYPKKQGNVYCIPINNIKESGNLTTDIYDAKGKAINYSNYTMKTEVSNDKYKFTLVEVTNCNEKK